MNAIGPYRILQKLGEGGMGVVYKAEDTLLDRQVAIKLVHQHLSNDESLATRFLTEAKLTASLLHANITTLYSLTEHQGQLAMILEFVEGITLEDVLKQTKPLDEDLAAGILMQTLSALEYAHERGIIHRDIKPSNIMITKSGQIKIMDFGIAQRQGSSRLTQTGKMVGTLHYMAPEQIMGHEAVVQSDLYAAGIVLYEMLTGDPPFAGKSDYTLMEAQIKTAPSLQFPTIRTKMSKVLQQALRKKADQRFINAGEFKALLLSVTQPYDSAQIRRAIFENIPAERAATSTASHQTQKATTFVQEGASISQKVNALPSWLPKAIFGVAALVLLVVCLILFLPDGGSKELKDEANNTSNQTTGDNTSGSMAGFNSGSAAAGSSATVHQQETNLTKARELYRNKRYLPPGENAVYYANEVLRLDPSHAEAQRIKRDIANEYEQSGDAAAKKNLYSEALSQYQFALAANAPDQNISRKIADMERRLGNTSVAPKTPSSSTGPASSKPAGTTSKTNQGNNTASQSPQSTNNTSSTSAVGQEKKETPAVSTPSSGTTMRSEPSAGKTEEVKNERPSYKTVQVPKNTRLQVQLSQTINSDRAVQGQRVKFTCPHGLTVNGVRVVDQGEEAYGTVTDVKTSQGQRPGKIEITMDATTSVAGESIPLYGVFLDISKGKSAIEFSQGSRFEVTVRTLITAKGY